MGTTYGRSVPQDPISRPSPAVDLLRRSAARLDVAARAGRFTREVGLALSVVLLVGFGAAGADRPEVVPTATGEVAPSPLPAPAGITAPRVTKELAGRMPDLSLPKPPAPAPRPVAQPVKAPANKKVDRWLPRGTGMWLHEWNSSEKGRASEVVRKSKNTGLTHLYVQTGSTRKGWIGDEVLGELLPATVGTGLKVIAWDFPKLIDPEADARRMAKAALWSRPGVPQVAAVAPDVETAAEGTRLSTPNVHRYYSELRKHLPDHIAILATVPWPSEKRTGWYPYDDTAPYADAFVPMAYWYNRPAGKVTATSMTWLARFGKPVMPAGQGYDGRLDAPYLKPDPNPGKSVDDFVAQARKHGARSISLWSWQTTQAPQWGSILRAAGTIGPKAQPKPVPSGPSRAALQTAEQRAKEQKKEEARKRSREKAQQKAPGRKHDRSAPKQ